MNLVRVPCTAIKPKPRGSNCPTDEADELVESVRDKGLLRPIGGMSHSGGHWTTPRRSVIQQGDL